MKKIYLTKPKHNHLFKVVVILINFLHRRCMDFRFKVIGEQMPNPIDHGWDGNFYSIGLRSPKPSL
jgi:hypothetical protein